MFHWRTNKKILNEKSNPISSFPAPRGSSEWSITNMLVDGDHNWTTSPENVFEGCLHAYYPYFYVPLEISSLAFPRCLGSGFCTTKLVKDTTSIGTRLENDKLVHLFTLRAYIHIAF